MAISCPDAQLHLYLEAEGHVLDRKEGSYNHAGERSHRRSAAHNFARHSHLFTQSRNKRG